MNNLDRIGFVWRGDWSIEEHQNRKLPGNIQETYQYLEKKEYYHLHCRLADYYGSMQILTHLDFPSRSNGPELAQKIFGLINHHYFDVWYKPRSDEAKEMRKAKGNDGFRWYEMLSSTMWLCLMHDQKKLLSDIADWTESWFEPEWLPIPVDPLWAKTYISIASSFRTKPLKGLEEMEDAIRKSRKKAPKLLLAAWDAARDGDQQKFEKTLLESIKHFISTLPSEQIHFFEFIAFGQSTVLAAARRLGMKLPDYGPEIMAYVPTSESIGLPGLSNT